jgi:hypothetical protein
MNPDNPDPIATGADIAFPQDGPNTDSSVIYRTSDFEFNLASIGVYRVSFQVSVFEYGQLVLTLNGAELAYTVVGRLGASSQITATVLVETTSVNSILTVRNPASGIFAAFTLQFGYDQAWSATLLIELVK